MPDTFLDTWLHLKPCNKLEAQNFLMKLELSEKYCDKCCDGLCGLCDYFVESIDEARLGKFLISEMIKGNIDFV